MGQVINNEWGKGIAFFAGANILPSLISALTGGVMLSTALKNPNPKSATALGVAGLIGTLLTAVGGRIWACVDSVKNAQSEIKVPVQPY